MRARERLETARTVAALLRDQSDQQDDDVSALTPITGNTRGNSSSGGQLNISQISTDNASQAMTRRRQGHIGAVTTVKHYSRTASDISSISLGSTSRTLCRAELDSHADTCSLNETAYVIEYLGKVAEVSGFTSSLNTIRDVPIVKAALAYDDHESGETIILMFNQALYFGNNQLPNILLNPNQMRSQGLIVEDCPKHLSRGKSTHSIIVKDENLVIPLRLHGVMSYFNVRAPMVHEIDQCLNVQMTQEYVEWEPYSDMHLQHEEELNNFKTNEENHQYRLIQSISSININYDDIHLILS
jgi:hypothetical protein